MKYKLSYVLTTYNKLQYLKCTLPELINGCKEDEEIVVVDGGSKDGTPEYLKDLFEKGVIHQFVSEPDNGEAHGYNKAFLMARGELIKIISDDDVYNYDIISVCKEFMLKNEAVDMVATNGMNCSYSSGIPQFNINDKTAQVEAWKIDKKPFLFTGLGYLLRRSSLPLLGMFHTGFIVVDFEFSYRITSSKAKIAFYSGCSFCSIVNPDSNSSKFVFRLYKELLQVNRLYRKQNPILSIFWWEFQKVKLIRMLLRLKETITPKVKPKILPEYKNIFNASSIELNKTTKDSSHKFIL